MLRAFLIIFFACFVGIVGAAYAQVCPGGQVPAAGAVVTITHGTFHRLPDAGFAWGACGHVRNVDGGAVQVPHPCIADCQAGAFSNGAATCLAAWKAANGIP